MNPYINKSNILVEKKVGHIQKFLNDKIKDTKLNITIGEIIELAQYVAFNEGVQQGKYEVGRELKKLIDVEEPFPNKFING